MDVYLCNMYKILALAVLLIFFIRLLHKRQCIRQAQYLDLKSWLWCRVARW